jgi:hypothetical protein
VTARLDSLPERPPSEVEWEELLVKYEITPRALRLAVEDAGGTRAPEIVGALEALLANEVLTATLLAEMAARAENRSASAAAPRYDAAPAGGPDAAGLVSRITEIRGRSFAAVQRRGISVWEWSAERDGTRVTPYRLLLAAVALDRDVLARVRAAGEGA